MSATEEILGQTPCLASDGDLPELLHLWTSVFEQPESVFMPQFDSQPAANRFTYFIRGESQIVSAVTTFVLETGDEFGIPVPVACLANVSTRPESRGMGLSTKLLKSTLVEAERRGCGWSHLFTGSPGFYARLGWRNVEGEIALLEVSSSSANGRELTEIGHESLEGIRALYSAAYAKTPLSLHRQTGDWEIKIPTRLHHRLALVPPDGYLLARLNPPRLIVEEVYAPPGSVARYAELLASAVTTARNRSLDSILITAPLIPELLEAISKVGSSQRLREGMGMARPIGPGWSEERLAALFARPDARFFNLDAF